ncbi:MAG: dihydrodipicolinate synthase family protein [Gemmatimonadetes bacterium]|nr:dihydrodipicolinate synthase family protein [Gemmatimonadota bacterium]
MMQLSGVFLPVPTPFLSGNGELCAVGFRENLRRWLAHPIAGVVVAGSTGEAPLLEESEMVRLVEWARDVLIAHGGRLLIAGAGCEATQATLRLTRAVAQAGGDAVLVRPPAYYRSQMTPAALRQHFEAVADASPVPVLLYHVPQSAPVEVTAGLVAALAQHPNIIGIKDSSGDLKLLSGVVEAVPPGFAVLVGSGAKLYAGLAVGAVGGIVAAGCLAPAEACEIYALFREGKNASAGERQARIAPLHQTIVSGLGVPGIKLALDLLGYVGGLPRPPLQPLTPKGQRVVEDELTRAGLLVPAR